MISVRRSAGRSRGDRGSTPSSRLRSRASRMARNFRLIESLWRYGIGGNLARFGCNLTRSVYLTLDCSGTNDTSLSSLRGSTFPVSREQTFPMSSLYHVSSGELRQTIDFRNDHFSTAWRFHVPVWALVERSSRCSFFWRRNR